MSLAPSLVQRLAAPLDALVVGETLGRYRVRRKLGRGGMGEVYLARDLVLGRSVALKIVAGAYSDSFLDEARTIARLNHPHIVQLYDFGQHKGGRFLALEYIDGISLRDRAQEHLLEVDEILRHTRAIANALTHAHASAVIHCDLKPSNVMIGRDGRVRVVDFGLARTADMLHQIEGGTPDWMAPEQWRGDPLTDHVDSWALGVMTAELLTGRHPLGRDGEERRKAACDPDRRFEFSCSRHVPASLQQVITRSLAFAPEARPSSSDWLRILDEILAGRDEAQGEESPYPGLAAFDARHARHYFGREPEIDEFLERLRTTTCLPIVGPSGVGKSSFLHAGVIPRLLTRERWIVLSCRPGANPVNALARELVVESEDGATATAEVVRLRTTELQRQLIATPTLLAARLATLARARDARVLVAIDQLEEVFTQGAPDADRDAFIQMLVGAADDPIDPVRVVFTVRDDFLGQFVGIRSMFVMKRLGPDDLRRTIVAPMERAGYRPDDPTIVQRLLDEVASVEVADLPLLQFACKTLWDGRDQVARTLRRATYDQMGGLAGALAQHAEQALSGMTPLERRTAREVLLRLISGTTRRSVPRDELVAQGEQVTFVIDRLLQARLLVQRNHDGDAPLVEIAHESLLHTWSALANWIDESKEERRFLDELETATSLWEKRGQREQDTWVGSDLTAVRHRAAKLEVALPARVEAFVTAGEQRQRMLSRRRWIRSGIAIALAFGVAIPVTVMASRYLDREKLIDSNSGTMDLVIQPFDWVDGKPRAQEVAALPSLRWQLYATAEGDPNTPGKPLEADEATQLAETRQGSRVTWRVRTRSNELFLRIDGRGRAGETCAPAWIRIQSFPGYVSQVAEMVIDLPTCQASADDMLAVPGGTFIYGGAGEPASIYFGQRDYDEPERPVDLAEFELDRTEVSNARFAMFARIAGTSGYRVPRYGNDAVHEHDADPNYPVTDIDWYTARAFCMYMGKSLPTDTQWLKAVRGTRDKNPWPRRLHPWGPEPRPACVNQLGDQDGAEWTTPVDSYACGQGPYGHVNLVGNVDEWIDRMKGSLAVLRGGSVKSPPELDHTTSVFANRRDPHHFDYAIGVRCATN